MADAGVELLSDVTSAAAVGGTEAVGRVPALYRAYRTLSAAAVERRPAALVLIDFPEFNLRLARVAKRAGVPVLYFIPPQIWAWRARRVETIRRLVSLVLAVFPFELALYRAAHVPVAFVGHPILDVLGSAPSRESARRQLGIDGDTPVVGLLPGSRREEIDRVFPVMRDAARRIAERYPHARFVLALAPTVTSSAVARHLDGGPPIACVSDAAYAVMRASDVLCITSGTATLEAALVGTPMVVCYRLSKLSEVMGRLLIRVPWISLVNIVLGRPVVPELYQKRATAERLATEALGLLDDAGARQSQRDAFVELARELGEADVGARAARHVLEVAGVRDPENSAIRMTMKRAVVDEETGPARGVVPHHVRLGAVVARLVGPGLAAAAIRTLGATLGLRVVGAEKLVPLWAVRRPLIYAMWHGRIVMAPWLNAELRRSRGARRVIVLTSRSRDGELLARFVSRFGLGVVRGSSSRGGASAVRVLATALRAGDDVAIAPDGPRGPAEHVQRGLIALAALTDAPIVPLGFAARPAVAMRSWDRFLVPLPFARAAAVFGAPIAVSGDAEREELRQAVESALDDVTTAAERLVGREPRKNSPGRANDDEGSDA